MPEFKIHGKSGGRGEVGCLRNGDGVALEIGNCMGVDVGSKEDATSSDEVHGVTLNVDGEALVEREVEG